MSEPSWIMQEIRKVVDAMIPAADPSHRDSFTRTLSNLAGEHFEKEGRQLRIDEMEAHALLGRTIRRTSATLRKLCGWPIPDETYDLDALLDQLRVRRGMDSAVIASLRAKMDSATNVLGEIEIMTSKLDGDATKLLDAEQIEKIYRLAGDAIAALHSHEPA